MKAITLIQPWASLVAIGAKEYETRSWTTNYRGPIAIHASKGFPKACQELCDTEPFRSILRRAWGTGNWEDALPRGMVIATAQLVDIRLIGSALRTHILVSGKPSELEFGDYTTGRYAWRLADVQPLRELIPAKGALGLWEWKAPEAVTV